MQKRDDKLYPVASANKKLTSVGRRHLTLLTYKQYIISQIFMNSFDKVHVVINSKFWKNSEMTDVFTGMKQIKAMK